LLARLFGTLMFFMVSFAFADSKYCQSVNRDACTRLTSEQELKQNMCEVEKKQAGCEEFYKNNPNVLSENKARDCNVVALCPITDSLKDYTKACLSNAAGAWGDMLAGLYQMVAGKIELSNETKQREVFFANCQSATCKRSMLGPYADLFKQEEIEGHANDKNLDPKDPANQNYLQGLSAKVLYKKLLERISQKMKQGTLSQPVLEPWSGQPAKPLKTIDEAINATLAKLGIKSTACYDPAVLAEMRCYALFSVLDPLLIADAALKLTALSGRSLAKALEKSALEEAADGAKKLSVAEKKKSDFEALKAHTDEKLDKQIAENQNRMSSLHVKDALEVGEPTVKTWQELGVKIKKDGTVSLNSTEVAQNMNAKMDALVASGKAKETEVIRPVLVYELNGKKIGVSPNEKPPAGAVRSRGGLLSIDEFESFVAAGKFPLGDELLAGTGNYPIREAMFLHDLNHTIGFFNNPEFMAANRRVAQKILDTKDPELKEIYRKRYSLSSEFTIAYPKEKLAAAKSEIEDLKASIGLQRKQFYDEKAIQAALNKMDRTQLNDLAVKLTKSDLLNQPAVPVGGAQHIIAHQVNLLKTGEDRMWPRTPPDTIKNIRPSGTAEQFAEMPQYTVVNTVSGALFQADSFTRVRPADWMREGYSGEKLSPMGNLGRICQSMNKIGGMSKSGHFYRMYCLGGKVN
jgi:hypothetical protein